MTFGRISLAVLTLVAFAVAANGQSYNIDLDIGGGSEGVGAGAPSSTFGGAANDPGFWNAVYATGPRHLLSIQDLNGSDVGGQMLATGGVGLAGGYNDVRNTGDYARLLNDFADIGDAYSTTFRACDRGATSFTRTR